MEGMELIGQICILRTIHYRTRKRDCCGALCHIDKYGATFKLKTVFAISITFLIMVKVSVPVMVSARMVSNVVFRIVGVQQFVIYSP